jgi:hypothetical protein
MNQTIVTKGKLLGIGLKKNTKIRKGNSALGYFDLNGKTIIPYNLKHYLRITTSVSPSRGGYPYGIKATPSLGASYGALESKEVSKNTSNAKRSEPKVSLNVCNNLRFKLEERLQFLRTECTKGSEAFEGGQLGGYTTRPEGKAFQLRYLSGYLRYPARNECPIRGTKGRFVANYREILIQYNL